MDMVAILVMWPAAKLYKLSFPICLKAAYENELKLAK